MCLRRSGLKWAFMHQRWQFIAFNLADKKVTTTAMVGLCLHANSGHVPAHGKRRSICGLWYHLELVYVLTVLLVAWHLLTASVSRSRRRLAW